MIRRRHVPLLLALLATGTPAWSQQTHRVEETEPNDTPAQAKLVALGDTIIGTISSPSDVDFFAVDIPAGTFVNIYTGPRLCLIDRDALTVIDCGSEDYGATFPFTTGGRYYIRVDGTAHHTGHPVVGPYQPVVQAQSFSLAPGDPVRAVTDLPPRTTPGPAYVLQPFLLAAGLSGELYAAVYDRILRVAPNGDTATVSSGLVVAGSMVVDPFGDLVFAALNGTTPITLWKLAPTGELSRVSTDLRLSGEPALAVGPDGDLWIGTDEGITRLDPTGSKKAEIPLKRAYDLAAGPSGELYVADAFGPCFNGVYVVRGDIVDCILPSITFEINSPEVELAVDSYGNLFVGKHPESDYGPGTIDDYGHVDWYEPGSTERRLHAHVPRLQKLTFARDAQGNMTSRLFAIDWSAKPRLVELAGADDRAAGAGFTVRFYHATIAPLPLATFGLSYLQPLRIATDTTGHTWSVENGTLPPGLTLSTNGVVKGVPTALGTYAFTVRATSGLRSWFASGTINVKGDLIDVSSIVAALLGGPALSPTQVQLLDQIGNKNGILDTGDLRAYLRSRGELPAH